MKIITTFVLRKKEDWQSDRMRWTRNPVYPFPGIGGLNPSSSAKPMHLMLSHKVHRFFRYIGFVGSGGAHTFVMNMLLVENKQKTRMPTFMAFSSFQVILN